VVETEGEAEAASIFEGLNDRGKPLSSLEKTKSLLVNMDGRVEGSTKKDINERFGKIYQSLFVFSNGHKTIKNFDEDGFQRFHWGIYTGNAESNSFENLKDEMYNMYRSGEYDRLQSFIDEYTLSLQESADAFDRIFRPEQRPETVETNLNRFLNLGQISNFVPLLIASDLRYGKDDTEKLAKIIKKLETAAFRIYSIDRRRSDTAETKLFTLAHKVDREQLDFDDIIDRIGEIIKDYADDDRFENDLREKNFYQTKSSTTIRYLIYHYGKSLGVSEAEDIGLDKILSNNYDVEHILAEGLDKEYIPDDIDELEEVVHRLGNLTIADSGWNKKYGNLPFNDKKEPSDDRDEAYSNSDLRVQRNLSEIDEFNQESIKNREDEIVEYALNEWDIN
jgi:hypothetical protein